MTSSDPISYYLRHPMHSGVMQFLHWEEMGIVECAHYPKGLENPPMPQFSVHLLGREYEFRHDDALPLATARRIWDRFISERWQFRQEDRNGVRMTGWRRNP